MRFIASVRRNRVQVWQAALLLLIVALVLPQLALADHASGHPDSQVGNPTSSSLAAYAALVAKYETGELVFHAPGRRDDRSFSAPAGAAQEAAAAACSARWVTLGKYYGQASERAAARAADASSARWAALGRYYTAANVSSLMANPELRAYRRYVAAANVASLAANPELTVYRLYVVNQACSESGVQC